MFSDEVSVFFGLSFDDWLTANLNGKFRFITSEDESAVMFAVVGWLVWKHRNRAVFQDECGQVEDILCAASRMVKNILEVGYRDRVVLDNYSERVSWCPPNLGQVKINTDGAASIRENWSAAGGVLRGPDENWISEFQIFVGRDSTLNAELWTVFHGFQMAKIRGACKVIVESDCMTAMKMIKECLNGSSSTTIVRQIKEASKAFEEVHSQFTKREGNSTADWLAKTCDDSTLELGIIDVPSAHVVTFN